MCRGRMPSVEAMTKLWGKKGYQVRESFFFGGSARNSTGASYCRAVRAAGFSKLCLLSGLLLRLLVPVMLLQLP